MLDCKISSNKDSNIGFEKKNTTDLLFGRGTFWTGNDLLKMTLTAIFSDDSTYSSTTGGINVHKMVSWLLGFLHKIVFSGFVFFSADGVSQLCAGRGSLGGLRCPPGGRIQSISEARPLRPCSWCPGRSGHLCAVWGTHHSRGSDVPALCRHLVLHSVWPLHVRYDRILYLLLPRTLHNSDGHNRPTKRIWVPETPV